MDSEEITNDMELENEAESSDGEMEETGPGGVYVPRGGDKPEQLICDESAYRLYHQAQTGAPCLSFDVILDNLGDGREEFPLTCYAVCGTQAEQAHLNSVIVLKMSNMHEVKKKSPKENDQDDSESDDSDDDEDDEKEPELESASINHVGCVNRIRSARVQDAHLAASWSEVGNVHIWDLKQPLHAVNDSQVMATYARNNVSPSPIFTFKGHLSEGFALDWCSTMPGWLATGDCNKNIHIWRTQEGGSWTVDQRPCCSHTASVEDIQWSPNEANVFASCSVDKSIRIWDARSAHKGCMLTAPDAHDMDVNVISWNKKEPFIVSGGDDGALKIWDLRQFQKSKPVAVFKHHTAPITSVEWNPLDSTVFAASGADDQITLWDLSVEKDTETEGGSVDEPDVPPQLLFIHQGQSDIKELRWHPQLPGVIISTAHSGFNIFRTISV